MDLKAYIAKGIAATGSLTALAETIGMAREALTAANGGRRGLPPVACGKLADLVGADRWDVVAASEILTEKDEAKRRYLLPFVLEIVTSAKNQPARIASNSNL